jgi:hypothetical protein
VVEAQAAKRHGDRLRTGGRDGGSARHGRCVHRPGGAGDEEAAAEVAVEWLVVRSESSGSGRRKSKRKVAAGTRGATISPDAAEALNKAWHFVEKAGGEGRGRVATGEAVASFPVELRSLVQRALTYPFSFARDLSQFALPPLVV